MFTPHFISCVLASAALSTAHATEKNAATILPATSNTSALTTATQDSSKATASRNSVIASRALDSTLIPELMTLTMDDPAPADIRPAGCEQLVLASIKTDESGWQTLLFKSGIDSADGGTGSGVLVIRGDEVSGFLRGDDGRRWRILASDTGVSSLDWIDESRLPPCAGSPAPTPNLNQQARAVPMNGLAACDTGKPVDVLVLYTAAAKTAAGGKAAIEGQIAAAFSSANLAYQNSAMAARITPVMVLETDYVSSDFGSDLERLANGSDGQLDWAHALRDVTGADMVALIREDGEYCGIAYLLYDNSASAANIVPFSVTAWGCLSTQTFAHELGHNMGCCHANGDGGGCTTGGLYSFSVGWRFYGRGGGLYRTVMAYSPGNRIDNFSNPNISVDGTPTGVPIGQANEADNASSIGLTINTIANARCSRGPTPTVDCDLNGVVDALDVAFGRGSDCDGNGALDSCSLLNAAPCTMPAALAFCSSGLTAAVRPSTPIANDYFGKSGAVGANTAVVGIPGNDDRASFAGKALVYGRVGENWIVRASLTAPDAEKNAQFGTATEVGPDMVVIGAPGARAAGVATGRVYVYAPNGTSWQLTQTIDCPEPTFGDYFGEQIALHGNVLVIASRGHQANGLSSSGAAFVYRKSGNLFLFETKLTASVPVAGMAFGTSVAVHDQKIVVGAPYSVNDAAIVSGAAFIFEHSNIGWTLQNKFEGTSGSTRFGQAVAIDSDRIAVGAPSDANDGYESGAISTYRFAGGWYRDDVIRNGPGAPRNRIGSTLSLSNGRLLVGIRPEQNLNGSLTMYVDSPSGWQRQGISYSGTTGYVRGDSGFVGAPYLNSGALNSGGGEFILWASDCNSDGIPDRCNIDLGSETDLNNDGIPDSCQPWNPDVNGDGSIDSSDLSMILLSFGDCPGCPEDVTKDGVVDSADLSFVLISI